MPRTKSESGINYIIKQFVNIVQGGAMYELKITTSEHKALPHFIRNFFSFAAPSMTILDYIQRSQQQYTLQNLQLEDSVMIMSLSALIKLSEKFNFSYTKYNIHRAFATCFTIASKFPGIYYRSEMLAFVFGISCSELNLLEVSLFADDSACTVFFRDSDDKRPIDIHHLENVLRFIKWPEDKIALIIHRLLSTDGVNDKDGNQLSLDNLLSSVITEPSENLKQDLPFTDGLPDEEKSELIPPGNPYTGVTLEASSHMEQGVPHDDSATADSSGQSSSSFWAAKSSSPLPPKTKESTGGCIPGIGIKK